MVYRGWVSALTIPETGHLATKQEVNNVSSRVDTLNNLISQGLRVEGPTTIDVSNIVYTYTNNSGKPQLITFKNTYSSSSVRVTHTGVQYIIRSDATIHSTVQGSGDAGNTYTSRSIYLTYVTLLVKSGDRVSIEDTNNSLYSAAKRNPDAYHTPSPHTKLTIYTLG